VTSDGQRFVMIERVEPQLEPTQLTLVQNWTEELAHLAPTH
jgi:hypothetical protein